MLGSTHFTLWQASLLTIAVTTGFLTAAAVFAAASSLIWLDMPMAWRVVTFGVLAGFLGLFALSVLRPKIYIAGRQIAPPKFKTLIHFTVLAAVDLGFAALAFWLVLPADLGLSFTLILPVFLLATAAGILSGVPGGVGPFELTCLALLPMQGQEPLLAAILGFRFVYYLLPGGVAMAVLLRSEWSGKAVQPMDGRFETRSSQRQLPRRLAELTDQAQRAEARLIHTGDFDCLTSADHSGFFLLAKAGNSVIALSDPVGEYAVWPELIARLKSEARLCNGFPVIYKCGAKTAELARQAGFSICQIGQEAVLNPMDFTTNGSAMRGLRRKLRQADQANIRVERVDSDLLPLAQMQTVSDQWIARRDGERGFSMGRFSSMATQHHSHFLAWQGGRLVGFIGLWQTDGETALDLLRTVDDVPAGVMQALITASIFDAAKSGSKRFSLASVPMSGLEASNSLPERFCHWVYQHRPNWHGGQGLWQFKQGFRPDWQPRYMATSGVMAAAIAGIDIAHRVAPQKRRAWSG